MIEIIAGIILIPFMLWWWNFSKKQLEASGLLAFLRALVRAKHYRREEAEKALTHRPTAPKPEVLGAEAGGLSPRVRGNRKWQK